MLSIKYSAVVLFITAILFNIANGANPNYMLQLVNAERKKYNLPALTLDSVRIKAQGYNWSTCGENIAYGQKSEVEVMNIWMNSPPHKANILDTTFKNLGVGYSSN
ncbi:19930_t:CDS:2, partial [Cetraspora pellucida]